jgi:hypothetical protein
LRRTSKEGRKEGRKFRGKNQTQNFNNKNRMGKWVLCFCDVCLSISVFFFFGLVWLVVWERSGEAGWTVGGGGMEKCRFLQILQEYGKLRVPICIWCKRKGRLRAPICILLLGSGRDW